MSDPPLGLRQNPFGDTADPDTFYPSPIHESACAELFAAVKTLAGLVVLTGAPGTGKTTVLRRVTRDVEAAGGRVLWCSVTALLDAKVASLVQQLDAPDATAPEAQREALPATLRADARQGGTIVVAVDEAQHLGHAELEQLRAFAEGGMRSGTRSAVLLVGQPELDLKLAALGGQRGTPAYVLRVVLPPLAASEVGPYVAHRLGLAGARQDNVFEPDAIERVAGYAEGIPRVINQLCDAALRTAGQAGVATVSAPIVDAAARRLALPFPDGAAVRGARHARRETPPADARRAEPGPATARVWLARASVAVLILVAAVLFAPRWTSRPPPPPPKVAAPGQAHAPQRPSIPPDPGALMPGETARVAPPRPPTAPDRLVEPPSDSGPSARVGTRGGTPAPLTSPAPAPSVARRAPPRALALLDNAEAGNVTEMRALLAAGVSPDARDATGMTPLMVAVVHDHGAVAELLLARGANVNVSDDGGVTALMLAANNGRTALLQRLVDRGANLNARTGAGWTPLTYAAWNGHGAVVRRLLAAGADPALTDRIGWTALQYATWRAVDVSRTRLPDAADPLASEDPGTAEAAHRRFTEVVSLLSGATRRR